MEQKENKTPEKITVSGVTFSADQVKTCTVTIDGRDIQISEKSDDPKTIGYKT